MPGWVWAVVVGWPVVGVVVGVLVGRTVRLRDQQPQQPQEPERDGEGGGE